jgi:hypothetical protein
MQVKILVAGQYNGEDRRNRACEVGDVLVTMDWYGKRLIEGGLAEEIQNPLLPPLEKKGGKSKKASPKKGGAAPVANVFLA